MAHWRMASHPRLFFLLLPTLISYNGYYSKSKPVVLSLQHSAVLSSLYNTAKGRSRNYNSKFRQSEFELLSKQEGKGDLESNNYRSDEYKEALALIERAKKIRESVLSSSAEIKENVLENVDGEVDGSTDEPSLEYRLYIDIGREEGTWMDPRWGASGKRIEFSVDISFLVSSIVPKDDPITKRMVNDNLWGGKSPVRRIRCVSSKGARLRRGFDFMRCYGGGYRIDFRDAQQSVVRFFLDVDGVGNDSSSSTYGDVNIPKGSLYFSIPCFGNSVSNISTREGVVTVRQMGWHTGWRREESRIVGVFKVLPLKEALLKDGY